MKSPVMRAWAYLGPRAKSLLVEPGRLKVNPLHEFPCQPKKRRWRQIARYSPHPEQKDKRKVHICSDPPLVYMLPIIHKLLCGKAL